MPRELEACDTMGGGCDGGGCMGSGSEDVGSDTSGDVSGIESALVSCSRWPGVWSRSSVLSADRSVVLGVFISCADGDIRSAFELWRASECCTA